MQEKTVIGVRESVLVEDWVGPDADERRESGGEPDLVRESFAWYDLAGNEINDPDVVNRLEEKINGSHDCRPS